MIETLKLYFKSFKVCYWQRKFRLVRMEMVSLLVFFVFVFYYGLHVFKRFPRPMNLSLLLDGGWKFSFVPSRREIPLYIGFIIGTILLPFFLELLLEKCFPLWARRFQHLQQLSRLVVGNGWLEKEGREKIVFPRMFYSLKKGLITLWVENVSGRFQSQFSTLEPKVELALKSETMSKELGEQYHKYKFIYNLVSCRVSISQVEVKGGSLKLMEGVEWAFDKMPHALIIGGTGSGKSFFILTLIESLLKGGATLRVVDPKRADLSDLAEVLPRVYNSQEDMISEVIAFYFEMMDTYDRYKYLEGYYTGCNYRDVGLTPQFLIFDEYVAFMDMLGYSKADKVMSYLRKIAMLGRQVGYFLILACQRPDAKYFADGMRDQFNLRVALGRNSDMGYSMVFGSETKKVFSNSEIKGRGYIDRNTGIVHEFYSPLVPKGYDFLKEIGKLGLPRTMPIVDVWTLERGEEEQGRMAERTKAVLRELGVTKEQEKFVDYQTSFGELPEDLYEYTIKELREEKGLTQEECGKFFGVSRQKFGDWERGYHIEEEERRSVLEVLWGKAGAFLS